VIAALAPLLAAPPATAAPSITTLSEGFGAGESGVSWVTAGKEGDLWFIQPLNGTIGRMTPAGSVTQFPDGEQPNKIATGPEGNLWFTQYHSGRVARLTPSGVLTEYSTGIAEGTRAISAGPDGNIWFSENSAIGRLNPTTGAVTVFSQGIPPFAEPEDITTGPNNQLWFTMHNAVGEITLKGKIKVFTKGITPGSGPDGIALGPDGNIWFTEIEQNRVARVTPRGVVTEFSTGITPKSYPYGITAGPDGNLWFTQLESDEVASISPTTGAVTEYHEGIKQRLPSGITSMGGALWFGLDAAPGAVGRITFG
jgi:streptogramin lyase